jgi:hypothetical protein
MSDLPDEWSFTKVTCDEFSRGSSPNTCTECWEFEDVIGYEKNEISLLPWDGVTFAAKCMCPD